MEKPNIIKTAIITGLIFGVFMTLLLHYVLGEEQAYLEGIFTGVLFGGAIYAFMNSKTVADQTKVETPTGKEILFECPANHFKNSEAVGGKLYLFSDRLHFKSHEFNLQNHSEVIPLSEIKEVGAYNILGFVPTGFFVIRENGVKDKFVLNSRKRLKEAIEQAKKQS